MMSQRSIAANRARTAGDDGAEAPIATVSLPERFDISAARAVHAELVQALTRNATVEVDASAVARTDTAGMQLLVAALHTEPGTAADPARLRLTATSNAFDDAAQALGLSALLPRVAAAQCNQEHSQP